MLIISHFSPKRKENRQNKWGFAFFREKFTSEGAIRECSQGMDTRLFPRRQGPRGNETLQRRHPGPFAGIAADPVKPDQVAGLGLPVDLQDAGRVAQIELYG